MQRYSVIVRKKNSLVWQFSSVGNGILIDLDRLPKCEPSDYSYDSLSEAKKAFTNLLIKRREMFSELKLSEMNEYTGYKTEYQVLEYVEIK